MVRGHVWAESLLGQPAVGHWGVAWWGIELHTNNLPTEHTSWCWDIRSCWWSSYSYLVGKRNAHHESCQCMLQTSSSWSWEDKSEEIWWIHPPRRQPVRTLQLSSKCGKQTNHFCTIAFTTWNIFLFRYCVRYISQPADTIRRILVFSRYRIFHQYKHHAAFKTREKGGCHPAFKLQCWITDTGERNWSNLCIFFNYWIPGCF